MALMMLHISFLLPSLSQKRYSSCVGNLVLITFGLFVVLCAERGSCDNRCVSKNASTYKEKDQLELQMERSTRG